MKKISIFYILIGCLMVMPCMANALTVNYTDLTPGLSSVNLPGLGTATGTTNFQDKTVSGVTGVGVSGGSVPGEISFNSNGTVQNITFTFTNPQIIQDFTIAFLYLQDIFADSHNEIAGTADLTGYTLTVTGATSATWSGAGAVVTNLSTAGATSGGGEWKVSNPFGNTAISALEFYPISNGGGNSSANSDFSFVQLNTVPEPGILTLLGSGLISLIAFRKKIIKG